MRSSSLLFSTLLTVAGSASVVAFFVLSVATVVHAQPRVTLMSFLEVDKDRDKQLDLSEAETAFPLVNFTDANGDGLVSIREAETAVTGLTYKKDHERGEEIINADTYVPLAEQYARVGEETHKETAVDGNQRPIDGKLESKDGDVKNNNQTDN